MEQLLNVISMIRPLAVEPMKEAESYLLRLTKPPGSLGKLEEIAVQLAGINAAFPLKESKKAIIVMAGDHGVCEEGVSAFPQEVTPQMVLNFLHGGAAVNVLARQAGADVVCVDMGIKAELEHEQLRKRRVRDGTHNIARGPAMTLDEAEQAVQSGIALVEELVAAGYGLFATGEMGIGNTTPSAAILSVLAKASAEEAVGRGTGLDDAGLARKRDVVRRAIAVNQPLADDPLDVLAKLGGFEIAGLVGVILGAAVNRCPVIIDGFIATVAALLAYRLVPEARSYMIASHLSEETGHCLALKQLGLKPMLELSMRLGEGTGAALVMGIVEASIKITKEMATFESAGVARG